MTTNVYGYLVGSNRLADVTQGATTVRGFTYDAAGNLTQDDRGGTLYQYFYNDHGRLVQFRFGNQVRAKYRYDFFERILHARSQRQHFSHLLHVVEVPWK